MNIKIISGPNLNILEYRNFIYGLESFSNVELFFSFFSFNIYCFQSNNESDIVNEIHGSFGFIDYFIVNFSGLSYFSVSVFDALVDSCIPYIEVHVSNVFSRPDYFRRNSLFLSRSFCSSFGFGLTSYFFSLFYLSTLF